jgi:hypothetical protein
LVFLAISRIEADICSVPAATVCTLVDTCSAAAATTFACVADSSALVAIWVEETMSSSVAADRSVAWPAMVASIADSESNMALIARANAPNSSFARWATRPVRSPAAAAVNTDCTFRSGTVTWRDIHTAMAKAAATPTVSKASRTRCAVVAAAS